MNDQNPENPPLIQQPVAPANDNKRRLRELLSIPERDRTDEQWDEIVELEIQLAKLEEIRARYDAFRAVVVAAWATTSHPGSPRSIGRAATTTIAGRVPTSRQAIRSEPCPAWTDTANRRNAAV